MRKRWGSFMLLGTDPLGVGKVYSSLGVLYHQGKANPKIIILTYPTIWRGSGAEWQISEFWARFILPTTGKKVGIVEIKIRGVPRLLV